MNKLAAVLLAVSTAGCASDNDGALHISGELADASRVTHVIGTNPSTGEQVVVDLKTDGEVDGRFAIALPGGEGSWVVTFADANAKGDAMKVATLQSGGLDAFRTKDGGALEFGVVHFSGRYAHGTATWDRLASAFGESESALKTRAKLDNLSLRYSNPDVDGDGEIDAIQGHAYRLDINGTIRLQNGSRDIEVADLIHGVENPSVAFLGTTILAAVPSDMNMNMLSGTIQFEQPFYGTALGDATPMVPAGQPIGYPHIKFGELAGAKQVGVVANGSRNAPNGTFRFGFSNGALTFSGVDTHDVELLQAATDYAVPFVRIRPVQESCFNDCDIKAVDVEWKTMTKAGWATVKEPRDARIDVVANVNSSKRVAISANLTDGATSQSWQGMTIDGAGILRNELSYITSSKICYVAVSYTSELGMKITSQTVNPGCF